MSAADTLVLAWHGTRNPAGHAVIAALTELPLTVDDCRARLAGRLEPSAIPRRLRRVAGLPRTSTGKIDRTGLLRLWAEGG